MRRRGISSGAFLKTPVAYPGNPLCHFISVDETIADVIQDDIERCFLAVHREAGMQWLELSWYAKHGHEVDSERVIKDREHRKRCRQMTEPSHPVFARLYDPVMKPVERTVLAEHRRYLADEISGTVLDLGAGTGAMFPYFDEATADGGDVTLFAMEPDSHMRRQAVERARDLELDIEIESAGAEALPFADDSFDVVIASLVFCTVPDFDAALSEVARVLKPGGEFRFLEHVRGEWAIGVAHDVLAPAWHTVAGGCHLNRKTDEVFRDDERFELLDYTRLEDIPRIVPVVRGTLKRRREGSILAQFA